LARRLPGRVWRFAGRVNGGLSHDKIEPSVKIVFRQPIEQLKRIPKPDSHRLIRQDGDHTVVIAAAPSQPGGPWRKCQSRDANQRSAELFGFERFASMRFQDTEAPGTQFARIRNSPERKPPAGLFYNRVIEPAMRAYDVRGNRRGRDLALHRCVKDDCGCGEIGRGGEQTLLDKLRRCGSAVSGQARARLGESGAQI